MVQGTISAGLGTVVMVNRITLMVGPESAPIKRTIADKRDEGQLVDATFGRRTRSVIFLDDGCVLLSSIQPETLGDRIDKALSYSTATLIEAGEVA